MRRVRCQQFGGGDLLRPPSLLPFTLSDSLQTGTLGSPARGKPELKSQHSNNCCWQICLTLICCWQHSCHALLIQFLIFSLLEPAIQKARWSAETDTKEDKRGSSKGFFRQRRDLEEKFESVEETVSSVQPCYQAGRPGPKVKPQLYQHSRTKKQKAWNLNSFRPAISSSTS